MRVGRALAWGAAVMLMMACAGEAMAQSGAQQSYKFDVSFPAAQSATPLDGRLLLILSTDGAKEPRFQIENSVRTQMIFGMDVDGMQPGQTIMIDERVVRLSGAHPERREARRILRAGGAAQIRNVPSRRRHTR